MRRPCTQSKKRLLVKPRRILGRPPRSHRVAQTGGREGVRCGLVRPRNDSAQRGEAAIGAGTQAAGAAAFPCDSPVGGSGNDWIGLPCGFGLPIRLFCASALSGGCLTSKGFCPCADGVWVSGRETPLVPHAYGHVDRSGFLDAGGRSKTFATSWRSASTGDRGCCSNEGIVQEGLKMSKFLISSVWIAQQSQIYLAYFSKKILFTVVDKNRKLCYAAWF